MNFQWNWFVHCTILYIYLYTCMHTRVYIYIYKSVRKSFLLGNLAKHCTLLWIKDHPIFKGMTLFIFLVFYFFPIIKSINVSTKIITLENTCFRIIIFILNVSNPDLIYYITMSYIIGNLLWWFLLLCFFLTWRFCGGFAILYPFSGWILYYCLVWANYSRYSLA